MVYERLEEARRRLPPTTGPLTEAANLVNQTVRSLTYFPLELIGEDRKKLEAAMNNLVELGKSLWTELGAPGEIFRK